MWKEAAVSADVLLELGVEPAALWSYVLPFTLPQSAYSVIDIGRSTRTEIIKELENPTLTRRRTKTCLGVWKVTRERKSGFRILNGVLRESRTTRTSYWFRNKLGAGTWRGRRRARECD